MPDICGSFGVNTKVAIEPSLAIDGALATFDASSTRIEILGENLQYSDSLIGGRGITGYIDPVVQHLRQGQRLVTGGLATEVGPIQLANWINPILGSTNNTLDEEWAVQARDIMIERDQVAHSYRYCVVNQAVIRVEEASPGGGEDPNKQIMQLALSFLGVEEAAGTFPAVALPSAQSMFWILADTTLSLDSVAYNVMRFEIEVRNRIQPLFRNQMVPGCFRNLGREVLLRVWLPLDADSSSALFDADFEGSGSITMSPTNMPAAFSAYSTIFNFTNMRRIDKEAFTRGQGEVPLFATFQAFRDGVTNPLEITNASA